MELGDALVAIKVGRALALLGAGFSVGAVNKNGQPLPIGGQLASNLLKAIGVTDTADYGLAAELYRKAHKGDPAALSTFLKREFEVAEVRDEHVAFAAEPWRSIYTTNFDDVIEVASARADMHRRGITTLRTPQEQVRTVPLVVHLHGFVGELAGHGFIQPFVLTRTSYLDMELPRTPWPTKLQTDAAAASAIFVIGYSLADVHIAKLLRATPANRRKTFVVLEPSPSAALVSYAEEFGTVLPIGLQGLIEQLSSTQIPERLQDENQPLLAFNELKLPDVTRAPTPDDVAQLLLGGEFNHSVYLHTVLNPDRPYTFDRNEALKRLSIWNGAPRKFLVHSRIGNGKTVFLQQSAVLFAQHGYRVFEGKNLLDSFHQEIERIKAGGGPLAFIFDGVREYEDQIKAVAQSLDVRDVLLVATRPTAFATDFNNLRNVLGEGFQRFDLDTLNAADNIQLDRLLEFYGLWGGVAGRTQQARLNFLRTDCGGEVRSAVLHVFKNSQISTRIREPVERLVKEGAQFTQTLAAVLSVRLSDALVDYYDVCELMGVDATEAQDVFAKSGVTDFFPEEGERFRSRSSILAEHVLSHHIQPAACSNALAILVERLIDYRFADERYEDSIPKILRFAVITRIFPDRARRAFIGNLYERLLSSDYLRADPQFWLQYAMARMEEENWTSAEKCLETAYNTARARPGYRTYMLDNQMARFRLLSALKGHSTDYDVVATKVTDHVNRRLGGPGSEIDPYVFRLTEPLIAFREQLALPEHTAKLIDSIFKSMADRLEEVRRRRPLDIEEQRHLHTLARRRK